MAQSCNIGVIYLKVELQDTFCVERRRHGRAVQIGRLASNLYPAQGRSAKWGFCCSEPQLSKHNANAGNS